MARLGCNKTVHTLSIKPVYIQWLLLNFYIKSNETSSVPTSLLFLTFVKPKYTYYFLCLN